MRDLLSTQSDACAFRRFPIEFVLICEIRVRSITTTCVSTTECVSSSLSLAMRSTHDTATNKTENEMRIGLRELATNRARLKVISMELHVILA